MAHIDISDSWQLIEGPVSTLPPTVTFEAWRSVDARLDHYGYIIGERLQESGLAFCFHTQG